MRHFKFCVVFQILISFFLSCGNKNESSTSESYTYNVSDAIDDIKDGKNFRILLKINFLWLKYDTYFSTQDSSVWMVDQHHGIPTKRYKLTDEEIDYLSDQFKKFYIDKSTAIKTLNNPKNDILPNNIRWKFEPRILITDSIGKTHNFEFDNEFISEQRNCKVQFFSAEFLSFYNFLARVAENYYLLQILPSGIDGYTGRMEDFDLEYHQDFDFLNSL